MSAKVLKPREAKKSYPNSQDSGPLWQGGNERMVSGKSRLSCAVAIRGAGNVLLIFLSYSFTGCLHCHKSES